MTAHGSQECPFSKAPHVSNDHLCFDSLRFPSFSAIFTYALISPTFLCSLLLWSYFLPPFPFENKFLSASQALLPVEPCKYSHNFRSSCPLQLGFSLNSLTWAFVFNHLRRTKNGARNWLSPKYSAERNTNKRTCRFVFCNETVRPAYAVFQIFYRELISRRNINQPHRYPRTLKNPLERLP